MLKSRNFFIFIFVIFCIVYLIRLQAILKTEINTKKNYLIRGKISSINQVSDNKWRLKVGSFWIQTQKLPYLHIGDDIEAVGSPEKQVINKFYHQFWLINPKIRQVTTDKTTDFTINAYYLSFLRLITDFRKTLEKIYLRILPDTEASLLAGIVLGSQQQLSPHFYEALRQSGTLHIVVASGMNVTILGKVVLDLLIKRFKRGVAIFVSIFSILIYTFLAGAEAPIVRAAIMGSVAFSTQVFGRQYWAGWALFLALGTMLLVSPELLFQIGFQLSALATTGLLFISPQVGEWLENIRNNPLIQGKSSFFPIKIILAFFQSDLTETIAAQIAVLPLLLVHFGQFNFFSAIPNMLVGILIPILMRFGGVLLVVGMVSKTLAQALAWLVWVPLKYMVLVIEFFGQIDWFTLEWVWPWWLAGVYWGGLWFFFRNPSKKH